jgi:hypothetical protein
MKKILTTFIFSIVITTQLLSQRNFTLFNMRGMPQAVYVNPSYMPDARVYVSLPLGMINASVGSDGFAYDDLFTKDDKGKSIFNTESLISNLRDKNMVFVDLQQELLGVGVKLLGTYVNFSVMNRFNTSLILPKDFLTFAMEGNGKSLLGNRANMDGIGLNINSFIEYGIGVTKSLGRFTIGGKAKMLSGIANFNTRYSTLGITTNAETFDLAIDGGAQFNTSNITGVFQDSTRSAALKGLSGAGFNFNNIGYGFDLGLSVKMTDYLTLTASVLDIGQITWKNDVKTYTQENFDFVFRGVDFNQFLADTSKTPVNVLQDTLTSIFKQNESKESYSTGLGTKYYVGAFHQFSNLFGVSALIYSQVLRKNYIGGVTLGFNFKLKKLLTINANYTYTNKSWTNLGLGLNFKALGPFQFYLITDNVLGFVMPNKAKLVNVCGGFSIYIKDRGIAKKIKEAVTPG